jgi:hypothetical protein
LTDEELGQNQEPLGLNLGGDFGGLNERNSPVVKPLMVVRPSRRQYVAMHKVGWRVHTHDRTKRDIYNDRSDTGFKYGDRLETVKISGSSCWCCSANVLTTEIDSFSDTCSSSLEEGMGRSRK